MKRWKLMAVALAAALLLSLCAACGKKAEEQTDGDGKPGSTQQDAAKDGSTNAGNKTADSVLDVSGVWWKILLRRTPLIKARRKTPNKVSRPTPAAIPAIPAHPTRPKI